MKMFIYSKQDVLKAVNKLFSEDSQNKVLALLDDCVKESKGLISERTQLGIIKLSGGDLEKPKKCITLAKTDYRDVLLNAETGVWYGVDPYKDLIN